MSARTLRRGAMAATLCWGAVFGLKLLPAATPQSSGASTQASTETKAKQATQGPESATSSQAPAGGSGAGPEQTTAAAIAPKPVTTAEARREAWKVLREGWGNKDTDHRMQAIYALGMLGVRSDTLPMLEAALDDKDPFVREAAARTLGDIRARHSIPVLHGALDDKAASVSFAAAQSLWRMGDQSGASIFVQVLLKDRGVSPGLIHSEWHDMHEKLHDPKFLAETGASQAAGAFLGPAGFGISAAEELTKDKDAWARALCATLLASYMDTSVHEVLQDGLVDKNWVVRAAAAEALGKAGDPADIEQLMPVLEDHNPAPRYKAAAAIIRLAARKKA